MKPFGSLLFHGRSNGLVALGVTFLLSLVLLLLRFLLLLLFVIRFGRQLVSIFQLSKLPIVDGNLGRRAIRLGAKLGSLEHHLQKSQDLSESLGRD